MRRSTQPTTDGERLRIPGGDATSTRLGAPPLCYSPPWAILATPLLISPHPMHHHDPSSGDSVPQKRPRFAISTTASEGC